MFFFLLLISILIVIILSVFIIILRKYNNFNYSDLNIEKFISDCSKNNKLLAHKVLFIYPHPDDETMATGGLIHKLSQNKKFKIKSITVTSGQKGDELLKLSPMELSKIRKIELANALNILKIRDYEVWDFMDGNLKYENRELKLKLKKTFEDFKPDLVVTYERFGIYGHPDHIALSKAINEIYIESPTFKIIYSTISPKAFKEKKLPLHMAEEKSYPEEPEYKLFINPLNNFVKFKAAKAHKSQSLGGANSLELSFIFTWFEYFTTTYKK